MERALTTPADVRPYAISFDVNHRPALWRDDTAGTLLRDLADRADIAFVGLDEAQGLWGADLETTDVRRLLGRPPILVVKDGATSATASPARARAPYRPCARTSWSPSARATPSPPSSSPGS